MRLFEIPVVVASLLGFGFLSGLHALPAHADLLFGEATNLGPTVNSGYHDFMGCPSPDGLELYFCSNRPGGYGGYDIWVSKRKSAQDSWDPPVNLGPQINVSSAYDAPGSLSADGLILYFESGWDLCTTTRATRDAPWGPRVSLGRTVVPSTSYLNALPIISSDGLELYFSSGRPRGYGEGEMWVTTRATSSDSWGPPVNLGPVVSAPATESPTWLSPDGLTLIFFSDRPGGFGSIDVWMTTRPLKGRPWSPPKSLGPSINTKYSDWISAMSPDGRWCYISDYLGPRPGGLGGSDLWQAPIIPIVDFNGDVTVDAADMALLEVNWGKSNSICDIGPFAWGDGVVDERDLAVLMESLMTPGPKTADVPYDAILSWTGPSFAEGYDVYFGTSLDDVRNATREDPCGVLVSMGQTETTYDPNGVLEFSRTYYWRIDTVLGPSNAAVCKGPVLSFTTEPFAHPIKNIIARASSSASGSGPDKTVDGSGLDTGDGHSTDVKTMWQSGNVSPHWIQFEFDKLYTLHELWVWNSNQTVESVLGFGAKTVKIEYSTDGTAWTPLEGVPEFAQAPGEPGYTASTTISFGGVSAMYVKLTVEKGWGATPAVGLSEVRFFHIPDRSATSP